MNFRTTLIIIVLLAGIGGAYFLFFQESADETPNEKQRIHQVYNIARENVQQVEISFADAAYQNLKLVKDATGDWQLENPFHADADNEKVNQMLDDILNKRVKQNLEVTGLTQYGLDTPSITLSLWTEGASPASTFFIGKKAINFSVYVKEKSEAHIFLIESSALDDLTKSPTDLRSRSVIKFSTETVSNIQIERRTKGLTSQPSTVNCEKRGDTWFVTHPIEAKADAEEIETLLSELRALQVSTFEADTVEANVPVRLENSGLDTPRLQIALTDGDKTYALHIGSAVPSENGTQKRVYVKSVHQDAIYTVSDDINTLLNKSAFDLRDKRVIDFQRTDTIGFVISKRNQQDDEKTVGIKNYDNIWELETPTGKIKTDAKAVDDLLFGVDSLEASAFVDEPVKSLTSYGLAAPSIKVAFTQRGEEKPAVLLIGDHAENGTVYVKAEHTAQVARVKRFLIDKIALGAAWLRDKQVLNFHIDDAIRLTLLHAEESLTCQRLGTNWRLTAPVKENANNAEVNAIIYELDDLRADAYVGSESTLTDTTTGFNSLQVQLTIELRNQKVYTLQVGRSDASGRFYARLQHEPNLIFLLNAELVPKLKTTLALLRTSEQGSP
ncbi:MAG: DUF4340 domain-containing protein [Candidatus Poribacteria bacterium]|nr:DUF4340 domain-containing protein [Candidatus Poribacteria bacterium]